MRRTAWCHPISTIGRSATRRTVWCRSRRLRLRPGQGVRRGESAFDAAMGAARLRLRPILMTSIAFIAGVAPLAVATAAGAASQNDIGTGVIGGMFTGTVFAIFLVPLFFVIVTRCVQHL